MKRPTVQLENSPEIYQAYGHEITPNRAISMGASALIATVLQPRVSYANNAKQSLKNLVKEKQQPAILMANHQDTKDPFVLTGGAWRSVLRLALGRTRTAAKDELFPQDTFKRWYMDSTGCFPVFRGDEKNHGPSAVKIAWPPMQEFCTEQLSIGNGLAFFGEGTCNTTDPTRIQKVQLGAAHIALNAAAQGIYPVFVPVAIHYGPRQLPQNSTTFPALSLGEARHASVVFGDPIPVNHLYDGEPKKVHAGKITRHLKEHMQSTLDIAIARY